MIEGLKLKEKYDRQRQSEHLHLQRLTATAVLNFARGFGGQQGVDELDIYPIPEIDKYIKKAREEDKRRKLKRLDDALQKYKKIEVRLKKKKEDG